MKSLFFTALSTILLLSKHSLASINVDYINNNVDLNSVQTQNNNNNNFIQNNNNVNMVNSLDNGANTNVFQTNNAQNNLNQNYNQDTSNQNTNTNNYVQVNTQPQQPQQPQQQQQQPQQQQPQPQPQQVFEAIPGSSKHNGGNNAAAYLLSGVGFTSVAFVAAFGYKSYRRNVEFQKFKEEILAESNTIAKPEEAKKSHSLTRLSRSISLSFANKNDSYINDTPVVSESVNSEHYSLTKNRAYKCHIAWTPLNSDEIILRRGDLVCVKESFNDGYSLGRNLSTKFDGIFPTCCLATPKEKIMGSELVNNGKFVSVLRRSSSKNKAKRSRRASSVSANLPSWIQKTELSTILTQ